MARRVTLRDVASHAQVSVTTVSNVVRGWQFIAADTRRRVEQSILELGYSPHSIAQGLRTGRTQVIGLIVPDLASLYFAVMVETVEQVAQQHGYNVFVINSNESPEQEARALEQVAARWVDGLLIVQTTPSERASKLLASLNMPTVALDRVASDYHGAACTIDNRQIVLLAIAHLCALGHTHIAHLVAPRDITVVEARAQAYVEAMGGQGRLIPTGSDFDLEGGYLGILNMVVAGTPLPTAVFASNDLMAIGAMRAFSERGIRVPEDVSIVGVDNIPFCRYLSIGLTTVAQPLDALAEAGMTMLLQLIHDHPLDAQQVILQPELIVRESTAAPRKDAL